MLPKLNRVDKNGVEEIFKKGKFLNSPIFTFKYIKHIASAPQISFIAPKNIAKLAVKRNSLRRLGYNVLKKYIQDFPLGLMGVFIFKKNENDPSVIENEIKNILSKIN